MAEDEPPAPPWYWISDGSYSELENIDRMPIHHKALEKRRIPRRKKNSGKTTERSRPLVRAMTKPLLSRGSSQSQIEAPPPDVIPHYLTANYDFDHSSESEVEEGEDKEEGQKLNPPKPLTLSQKVYVAACARDGVVVKEKLTRSLDTNTLDITPCLLSSEDIRVLSCALATNMCVTTLDLSWNPISRDAAMCLVDMLEENSTIHTLSLSHGKLGLYEVGLLTEMLSENIRIHTLSAAGNDLDDECAKCFAEALKYNRKLRKLDLSGNCFHDTGGRVLAKSVENNDGLQEVNIGWNHIRLSGATAWGDAIKHNEEMVDLNLSWNGFCDEGAQAIGKGLETNIVLQHINLSSNRIGHIGSQCLSKALKLNKTLKSLKLCQNPVSTAGILVILSAINDSPESRLELLDCTGIQVVPEVDELVRQIQDNRKFIFLHSGYVRSPDVILARTAQKPDKRCKSAKSKS